VSQVALRSLRQRAPCRRISVFLICGAAALLAPGASGSPNVPGDPTPPEVTPVIVGTLGANGWRTSNVTVNWRIEDPESIILETGLGCLARTLVADTVRTDITCWARSDGGTTTKTITIRLDKTAPTVSGSADRPPDANGWYNHPLTASFSGTDGISGIAACSSVGYGGPDATTASVGGTCRDNAGNVGNGLLSFKYDATAPTVSGLSAKPGNRVVDLTWRASADTVQVDVYRSPGVKGERETLVFRGTGTSYRDKGLTPGRKYRYAVAVYDQATNRAAQAIEFVGRGKLLNPAPGQQLKSAPFLTWTPVKGATYYNVVLVRARRVYSAWPRQPRLQLPPSWTYRGRRHRLRPGTYRWYVWPGFGGLSAGRYGRLLGGSTFVVTG
jgi:hypothetical protein